MTPMNMHLEELTASETFVVFVLSIKKDGKNNNKSVILCMPILFNCDFMAGPMPGMLSNSLSSNFFIADIYH